MVEPCGCMGECECERSSDDANSASEESDEEDTNGLRLVPPLGMSIQPGTQRVWSL